MHTVTSRQILSPVADAISQLIIVSADAETYNTPMQDLTEVAAVVNNQAANLVQIGQSMLASSNDEQLKQEMPQSCAQIAGAGNLLVEAAAILKADPCSKSGREKLVEACKGILQGTTHLMDVYDESEVRRLVRMCDQCESQVGRVNNLKDVNVLIQQLRSTGQFLVELTSQVSRRIEEILYPEVQRRLRFAIERTTRSLNLLISSCKAVAQHPDSIEVQQLRSVSVDQLCTALEDVKSILKIREYSAPPSANTIEEHRRDVQKQLVEIMRAAKLGELDSLQTVLETFFFSSDLIINATESSAKQSQQPEAKEILANCESIRKEVKELQQHALSVCSNPENRETTLKLFQGLTNLSDYMASLEELTERTNVADLRQTMTDLANHNEVKSTLAHLYNAARSGDQDGVEKAQRQFEEKLALMDEKLSSAAAASSEETQFQAIRSAQADVKDVSVQLVSSAKAVAAMNADASVLNHFSTVVTNWEKKMLNVEDLIHDTEAVFPPQRIVAAEKRITEHNFAQAVEAGSHQDREQAREAIANVMGALRRLNSFTIHEIDKSDDPEYKERLREEMKVIQTGITSLKEEIIRDEMNVELIRAKEVQVMSMVNDLEKLIVGRKGDLVLVGRVAIPEPEFAVIPELGLVSKKEAAEEVKEQPQLQPPEIPAGPIIETINGEEVEIVVGEAPQPLPEEEAKENPIKAVAQDLKVAISQWSSNSIVDIANAIGQKMAQISVLYKANTADSRKHLIQLAKDIQQDVKLLENDAQRVAGACKDRLLKTQVIQGIEKMSMISQQLKIVSAVKAAEPLDLDSEKQLVQCTKNLMQAMQKTLCAVESASIRTFRVSAKTAVAVVKFRKTLYRSSGIKQ